MVLNQMFWKTTEGGLELLKEEEWEGEEWEGEEWEEEVGRAIGGTRVG